MVRDTRSFYKKLKECFISSESNNTDKAKRFRFIWEEFAREIVPSAKDNLSTRMGIIYDELNVPSSIRVLSDQLRDKLNTIVHKDLDVSSVDLKDLYRQLLLLFQYLSGVEPDESSKVLSGIEDKWYTCGLNDEQKAAVMDDAKTIVVDAGPGTGKTHLLVHKILFYLKDNSNRSVVSLSYTNAAAIQLKDKFLSILKENGIDSSNYDKCRTATIHSFCYYLISMYFKSIDKIFDYEIMDDSDIPNIAEEICSQYNLFAWKEQVISLLTNGGSGDMASIVEDYKKKHHFIRVDEILNLFLNETEKGNFKQWLMGKIDCLLVDEVQDLTPMICKVIELLIKLNPNIDLFFVGDPRQNIFGYNGGSFNNCMMFLNNNNLRVSKHQLRITYRCPQSVLDRVNGLEFMDCNNPKLELKDKSLKGTCKISDFEDRTREALYVAQEIERIKSNDNTCVICTGLWYLEETARKLNEFGIPFIVKGGRRYLNESIKLINHCLRIISSNSANSKFYLERNIPNYNKSKLDLYIANCLPDILPINVMKDIRPILSELNYGYQIVDLEILDKYIEMASNYKSISDLLFACSMHKNDVFSDFYQRDFNVKCLTEVTDGVPPVTLTTIHSAKGLEWENVFLVGAAKDILPSYKCYSDKNRLLSIEETKKLLNEEKKKYYVAVTRSKNNLYITYPNKEVNKYGKTFVRELSPFVIR